MPKNLHNKLSLLLEDLKSLPKAEALRRLEELFNNELKFLESEHEIGDYELNIIHAQAITEWHKPTLHVGHSLAGDDGSKLRTLAYVDAVQAFMKQTGLIAFTLKYKSKK